MSISKMKNRECMSITGSAKADLSRIVTDYYPVEACGVLLGNKERLHAVSVASFRNCAEERFQKVFFEIDPLEMYKAEQMAEKKGLEIVGIFHSHPDKPACLSDEDERYMVPGIVYLIASVTYNGIVNLRVFLKEKPESKATEVIMQEE